jgi:hypothetical protein
MFVESTVRLSSLMNLLVSSRVKTVEPKALARALRMLPRSKVDALPKQDNPQPPGAKPRPTDPAE